MSAVPAILLTRLTDVGARGPRSVLEVPPIFSVDAGAASGEIIHTEKEKKKSRKFDHFLSYC